MTLTSEITLSALSYQGDERPVKLEFKDAVNNNASIELYQNVPNPWSDQTVIRFQLPNCSTRIIVHSGRQWKTIMVSRGPLV